MWFSCIHLCDCLIYSNNHVEWLRTEGQGGGTSPNIQVKGRGFVARRATPPLPIVCLNYPISAVTIHSTAVNACSIWNSFMIAVVASRQYHQYSKCSKRRICGSLRLPWPLLSTTLSIIVFVPVSVFLIVLVFVLYLYKVCLYLYLNLFLCMHMYLYLYLWSRWDCRDLSHLHPWAVKCRHCWRQRHVFDSMVHCMLH